MQKIFFSAMANGFADDFTAGSPSSSLWLDVAGGTVADTFEGRTQSLYFGGFNARYATTVNLDTRLYKALEFDLIYGNNINRGEYLDPGEEIVLEYSTNGGGSWLALQRYSFPGEWTPFKVNLPTTAQAAATQLRWRQPLFNNSLDADVWAIDNIAFKTTPYTPPTTANFSEGPNSGLWKDIAGATVNDTFGGNSQSLFFDGFTERQATTVNLNTTLYKALEFDLIYGNDSNGGEYLDPGEEVVLEYSTNGGGSWFALQRYSFPGSWTQFKVNLPSAAQAPATQLRWRQPLFNNSLGADVWAIDNIVFKTTAYVPPTSADFSTGPNSGLWRDMSGAVVNSVFDGNPESLFFGGFSSRQATTVNLDTRRYKALAFDLIYGNDKNAGEYLDPGEEVVLQYSTNGGVSWTDLQRYSFPGIWTQFKLNLPSAAQNANTQLRWRQALFNNSQDADVWAIDNIAFKTTAYVPPTTVDFSTGPNDGLWRDMSGAIVNNVFSGRTESLYFGGFNSRQVTSVNLDTTRYKALEFDLIYGNDSNGGEYLDPGEEVILEYSNNGGGSWTALQRYSFLGSWTQFKLNLPTAAQSTSTQLRWRQPLFNNSQDADVWAIDNITFQTAPYIAPTTADFSTGPNAGLWRDMSGAVVIETFAGRTRSLFFNGFTARQATTVSLDTRLYKSVEFDLIYGNDANGGEFLDPGEEVSLEYSSNGGAWKTIRSFNNSGDWSTLRIDLPTAAQSAATQLRWRQRLFNNSLDADVWAIDNIKLIGPPPGDSRPPVITGITTQGFQLAVNFSEAVVATAMSSGQFAARVGTTLRSITSIAPGASSSQLLLTLSGALPSSSEAVRLLYNDPDPLSNDLSGVVQDLPGNDMASIPSPGRAVETFRTAATVTTLAPTYTKLTMVGAASINGIGNASANTITGNSAVNRLDGLAGNDVLKGGGSGDIFRFSTALDEVTNRDQLTDFNPAAGDLIELENAIFTQLSNVGILSAGNFKNGAPTTADHHILYNNLTGALSYDANGNGVGGAIVFATLPIGLALQSNQFIVT